jgi:GNAT superfamily N-acetyltransferase
MSNTQFLRSSLKQLIKITVMSHSEEISTIANLVWRKHLQAENPLWKFVTARPFSINDKNGSAHVIAMVDRRLPTIGLVGFFACTNPSVGAKVLKQASAWLKEENGIKDVYGPINGTITRDYRLNLSDDYRVPGEPVNPIWYVDAFKEAGFTVFNRYVSGISRHYSLFIKLISMKKPAKDYSHIVLRPFDAHHKLKDLKKYHELMNAIFPSQSIYCPVLSWEERVYNIADRDPIFDPNYTYFLEEHSRTIGFIVAYPYQKKLIVKTIGLLPEHRGKNLSVLLIKKVHDQAKKDGLEAAIYATIRVGNAVYKMKRPGVKVYRKYVTMHKTV